MRQRAAGEGADAWPAAKSHSLSSQVGQQR